MILLMLFKLKGYLFASLKLLFVACLSVIYDFYSSWFRGAVEMKLNSR